MAKQCLVNISLTSPGLCKKLLSHESIVEKDTNKGNNTKSEGFLEGVLKIILFHNQLERENAFIMVH